MDKKIEKLEEGIKTLHFEIKMLEEALYRQLEINAKMDGEC